MKLQDLVDTLENLEFFPSVYHSRVLSTLIQSVHPLTARDVSQQLALADSKVYPTLKELEEWGIIKADLSKRPKEYYFDNPHLLQNFLQVRFDEEAKNKSTQIESIITHANQIWEPDEFELGNIAQIYKSGDIERELLRHLKLSKKHLFLLMSAKSIRYVPVITQILDEVLKRELNLQIALPSGEEWDPIREIIGMSENQGIELKQSYWSDGSYVIRDRSVMMNIMHSKDDVAMVTNDDLLVSNIRDCWKNTSCCSPELVKLELNF